MNDLDLVLAEKYGSYASYTTQTDPMIDTFGDSPAAEVDRLLDIFAQPQNTMLDLGCGAGFTLCRLAPKLKSVYGFEQEAELLEATRLRVEEHAVANVTLVAGNVAEANNVAQLPDNTFDIILSRRGPNVNEFLIPKLKSNGVVIQELAQDSLGLKEIFGRTPFLPQVGNDPHWLIYSYRWLGLLPVSVKDYFYEEYFRDCQQLIKYLQKEMMLSNWRMPKAPFEKVLDEDALNLYVKYNSTPKGIRIISHRKVYLFRKANVQEYPAIPDAKPLY